MLVNTTTPSPDVWSPSSALRTHRCQTTRCERPSSPCVSVVSASGLRKKIAMPLTGLRGVTRCQSSRPVHLGSQPGCSRLCSHPLRRLLPQPSRLPSKLQHTYMPRGMMFPTGVRHANRQLEVQTNIRISCVAGRGMRPRHVMSARLRRISGTCHKRPERCCSHRPDHTLLVPSVYCPPMKKSSCLARNSG